MRIGVRRGERVVRDCRASGGRRSRVISALLQLGSSRAERATSRSNIRWRRDAGGGVRRQGSNAVPAVPPRSGPSVTWALARLTPLPGPLRPTNAVADDPGGPLRSLALLRRAPSGSGDVSCATCHDPAHQFADPRPWPLARAASGTRRAGRGGPPAVFGWEDARTACGCRPWGPSEARSRWLGIAPRSAPSSAPTFGGARTRPSSRPCPMTTPPSWSRSARP